MKSILLAVRLSNHSRDSLMRFLDGRNLSIGDISSLDCPSDYFCAVIDSDSVYCNSFESSHAIYREAASVLKTGGSIFVHIFADSSFGDGSGQQAGEDAYLCSDGPLAGKVYARFNKIERIPKLLCPAFKVKSTELLSMSCNDQKNAIKELIATGVKA